jgi:hypothetical protein
VPRRQVTACAPLRSNQHLLAWHSECRAALWRCQRIVASCHVQHWRCTTGVFTLPKSAEGSIVLLLLLPLAALSSGDWAKPGVFVCPSQCRQHVQQHGRSCCSIKNSVLLIGSPAISAERSCRMRPAGVQQQGKMAYRDRVHDRVGAHTTSGGACMIAGVKVCMRGSVCEIV